MVTHQGQMIFRPSYKAGSQSMRDMMKCYFPDFRRFLFYFYFYFYFFIFFFFLYFLLYLMGEIYVRKIEMVVVIGRFFKGT